MTIPVSPGPWAWLAQAGKAVGDTIQAGTDRQNKERAEAGKHLQDIFDAVQSGGLQSSVFKSPYVVDLAKRSGVGDFLTGNIAAKPEEKLNAARSEAIPGAVADMTPTARNDFALTGKPATKVEQQTAGITEKVLGGDLTQAQQAVVAKVPEAPVASAVEAATVDPQVAAIADRHVLDLYSKLKRLPTADEAMKAGLSDPTVSALGTRLDKTHYGEAIERQRRVLAKELTDRIAAQAKLESAGDPTRFLNRITQQMEGMRKQRADIAKALDTSNLAALHIRAKREGKTPAALQAEIQGQIDMLDAQIGTMQQQYNNAAGVVGPAGTQITPQFLKPEQITSIIERIKKQPALAAQIDKDVAAGKMSPDDAKKIRDAIKGGPEATPAKPKGAGGRI